MLSYTIHSIPLKDDNHFEHELYVIFPPVNGAAPKLTDQTIDLVFENEASQTPQGFILTLTYTQPNGQTTAHEVGTDDETLPLELLDQMRKEQGLALFELDQEQGTIRAMRQLNLPPTH